MFMRFLRRAFDGVFCIAQLGCDRLQELTPRSPVGVDHLEPIASRANSVRLVREPLDLVPAVAPGEAGGEA
jgi:hypothetical protein